jgi:ankyrin repeat protein
MSSRSDASGSGCGVAGEEELSARDWVNRAGKDGEVALVDRPPGGNVNCVDGLGRTALMWACHYDRVVVMRALLAMPGIDVGKRSELGCTAAHYACDGDHDDAVVLELLASHGADMAVVDINCYTPLHIAAGNGKVRVASFLLSLPAVCDTLHLRHRWGKTAEERARSNRSHVVADMIAEAVCVVVCFIVVIV